MTIDPIQLLKKLEPPVRPVPTDAGRVPKLPLERQGFDELLALVSTGAIRSDRAISATSDVSATLEPAQLERLAAAADLAESAGARRVVMLIDGRGLVVDVPTRRVEQELASARQASVIEIDAAVYVAGEDDEVAPAPLPPPGTGLVPPTVARHLTHDSHTTPPTRRAG